MKRSKTTDAAIARLYATMATAAAKQAMKRVSYKEQYEADRWIKQAIEWMDKSSAEAIKWHYTTPGVDV